MQNKKIVLITSEFPPLPGGIGNHAFFLSKYLTKKGYLITVISDIRSYKEDINFDAKQDFKTVRIKRNKVTYLNRVLKAIMHVNNKDVIICSGKFSLWIGTILRFMFPRKKYLAVLHGTELTAGGFFSKKVTKWSLRKFDNIIAVSEFTKQITLKVEPTLKIVVINNGVEINPYYSTENTKNNELTLVTVGNLTKRKGQQNIIKALPLLITKYPKIQYHCIGIPSEKDHFIQLAKELNVLPHITFFGALSEDKKNAILAKSTIFCMLSSVLKNGDVEGFGIAILEANLLGIPAIGSNNSGIVDAIRQKYSGLLIDPNDADQFLLAIDDILCNYDEYSENAKIWAKKFDWNQIILKYIDSIES